MPASVLQSFLRKSLSFLFLLFSGWVLLKVLFFEQHSYVYDLFSNLQMSYSWLKGYPLLYESRYGEHALLHNFYFNLLLAPFTVPLGAYGLFIALALTHFLACAAMLRFIARNHPSLSGYTLGWLLVFVAGIYGFWLFHNPTYGFHVELFYPPLAIFFGLALLCRKTWQQVIAALLLVLVKEDGAVVACCIHLYYTWLMQPAGNGFRKMAWLPVIKTAVLWLIVFVAGMVWLSYLNSFGAGRTGNAFAYFLQFPAAKLFGFCINEMRSATDLMLPALFFIWLFFGWRNAAVLFLLMLPLFVVGLVSSMLYYPFSYHGLTWPPRFATYHGFSLAAMLMLLHLRPMQFVLFKPPLKYAFALCLVLFLFHQKDHLSIQRGYAFFYEIKTALNNWMDEKTDASSQFMAELARHTPVQAGIAVPAGYYNYFHHHRYMWYNGFHLLHYAKQQPGLIVADTAETEMKYLERYVNLNKYSRDTFYRYEIYHNPLLRLDMEAIKQQARNTANK